MQDIQTTLDLFQDAFQTFDTDKLNYNDYKDMLTAMNEEDGLTEQQVKDQFFNMDSDQDGLITFQDFKRFILSTTRLSAEDIAYIQSLHKRHMGWTVAQFIQQAAVDNRQVGQFFQGCEGAVTQAMFAQLFEKSEDILFGNVTSKEDNSKDPTKAVQICIGFLNEYETDTPELEIQDVFCLLQDNHSTITQQEWPVLVKCLSDKHDLVIQKCDAYQQKVGLLGKKQAQQLKVIKELQRELGIQRDQNKILNEKVTALESMVLQLQSRLEAQGQEQIAQQQITHNQLGLKDGDGEEQHLQYEHTSRDDTKQSICSQTAVAAVAEQQKGDNFTQTSFVDPSKSSDETSMQFQSNDMYKINPTVVEDEDEYEDSGPREQSVFQQRSTTTVKDLLIRATYMVQSKATDNDHLNIRKPDHKHYKQIQSSLEPRDRNTHVFSDNIQLFGTDLVPANYIILITPYTLYLYSPRYELIQSKSLTDLEDITLIKTNPSVMAMQFRNAFPFLVQAFKRTQIVLWLLKQTTFQIYRSEGFEITMKSGKSQILYFDNRAQGMVRNVQLNNFDNSLKCGYLDKLEHSFFGGTKWASRFCVLTNVGLLYFQNPLHPPKDLFPVSDCVVKKLTKGEDGYVPGCESFKLENSSKQLIFKCLSQSEFEAWSQAIEQLKQTSKDLVKQ